MAAFFASGRVVDLILLLMLTEALVVLAWWHRTGRGLAPAAFLPFLLAGACLMLALRAALVGAAWPWMALALLGALLAHLLDLWRRWR
ncbi:hypothetical protein JMJ55_09925 [Belnapia sp. T6]|uniref:DUF2568 domain-containing protein n=1 Tax=Belnapia mucosa TaxID=2804532 RepID=A0ABS1V1R9_9PROT|nr:hypothetical protein [Belnapia mucosa]MBL6455641.1 hypothetical protein [Belnapia mucosa]